MLNDFLPTWERNVFEWFYGWPDFLDPLMVVVTQLGGVYILPLLLISYVLTRRKIILVVLTAGAISTIFTGIAKLIFERGRPVEFMPGVQATDMIWSGSGGFPSGHTAMVVAFGVILLMNLPKIWWIPVVAVVLLVAISRLTLGMHLPLDVLGGAFIGLGAAFLVGPVMKLTAKILSKR